MLFTLTLLCLICKNLQLMNRQELTCRPNFTGYEASSISIIFQVLWRVRLCCSTHSAHSHCQKIHEFLSGHAGKAGGFAAEYLVSKLFLCVLHFHYLFFDGPAYYKLVD